MSNKSQSSAPLFQLPSIIDVAISLVLLLVALVISIALFSYNPADPAWRHNNGSVISNTLGSFGAWYSDLSFSLIGRLSYLIPLALVALVVHIWREKKLDKELFSWRLSMLFTAILSGCVLWAEHDSTVINTIAQTGGGAVGAVLAIGLEKSVKSIPIIMLFSTIIFTISMSLIFNLPWGRIADWIGAGISAVLSNLFGGLKRQPLTASPHRQKTDDSPNNTALQDKIKHLNEEANKRQKEKITTDETIDHTPKKSMESTNSPSTQPTQQLKTTADTAEKRSRPPHFFTEENSDDVETNVGIVEDSLDDLKPIQLSNINRHHETPRSDADIPFQLATSKATHEPSQTLVNEEVAKSEPSFFDFERITSQKTSTLVSSLHSDETVSNNFDTTPLARLSSRPETKSTDSLTSTFSTTPLTEQAVATQEPQHQAFDIAAHDRTSLTAQEFSPNTIPEAKPKRTVPTQTPVTDTPTTHQVNSQSLVFESAQPVEQVVDTSVPASIDPINKPEPLTESPTKNDQQYETKATNSDDSGVISQTLIQPQSTASSATIGKIYSDHTDVAVVNNDAMVDGHTLPGVDLLDTPPAQKNAYTEDVLAEMAGVLEQTLTQFNIKATVMHVSPGPVITRFELELAPGIQAKKITNLSQDLARALAVSRVRVEEVIPGSSYVGLEVPNKQRQVVYFRDIVHSKAFQESQSPLTISLGSDTSGKPQVVDLMKMPHALVAGTTGSGKSVCINVMLLSMLYKASPKDVRLILVDPKMLEMSMYEDIPHLLTPVITDMNEAENALTWAVGEMERRYQLMAALKVRKIDAFNEHVDEAIARGEPLKDPLWEPDEQVGYTHHPTLERLPFIVIVIDELADMMMVVGKQVEQLIARLTQKARAAGIHVVLATQRPSTDVLTGLIKANVPTRIAFQVSSGTDSRVIIDGVGAEKLLGHGDMLYVPPGASHPQRLHGAFVGDAETDRITNYLRSTGEAQYIEGITRKQDPETLGAYGAAEAAEGKGKEDADPLYEEAVQVVLETGKASISSVQRHLRIGYNRAARMIEDMQAQGIVSEPVNGVRKVIGK